MSATPTSGKPKGRGTPGTFKGQSKRPLTSPTDSVDPKKSKPVLSSPPKIPEESVTEDMDEMPEGDETLTVSEDHLQRLLDGLRDHFDTKIASMITCIVDGVVTGINDKVNKLELENKELRQRVEILESKHDRSEQYSRRNCLRLSGIQESAGESTDVKVMEVAAAIADDLTLNEVDRTHRLRNRKQLMGNQQSHRPRDIIIKFISYRARQKFMKNKKFLREKGFPNVFVNEHLTPLRDELFYQARKLVKDKRAIGAWTSDGAILVKVQDGNNYKVHRIETPNELARLTASLPQI